jgi:hypothetical protein
VFGKAAQKFRSPRGAELRQPTKLAAERVEQLDVAERVEKPSASGTSITATIRITAGEA